MIKIVILAVLLIFVLNVGRIIFSIGKNYTRDKNRVIKYNTETFLTDDISVQRNFGKSYVVIFKLLNIAVSLFIIIISFIIADENQNHQNITLISGFLLAILAYWLLTFPIKIFENIITIAKNSSEILAYMKRNK